MEVRFPVNLFGRFVDVFSHTPTNVDLNKLPKIERTLIKLDRLIGKGAFGMCGDASFLMLFLRV